MKTLKTYALIAAATTAFAGAANATIFNMGVEEEGVEVVSIDGVNAPLGSELTMYDYTYGEQGEELGSVALAGPSIDVRVQLDGRADGDLLAVLTGPAGNIIDTKVVMIDDN